MEVDAMKQLWSILYSFILLTGLLATVCTMRINMQKDSLKEIFWKIVIDGCCYIGIIVEFIFIIIKLYAFPI